MTTFLQNRKFIALLAFLFIAHVVFFIFAERLSQESAIDAAVPVQMIDGTKTSIGAYRSRPLLVHFWATSCKTCITEIPQLKQLYSNISTRGVEMLAVAMPYDRPDIVITYAKKMAMPWPVVLDVQGHTLSAFGRVQATPTTFLLDKQGRVHYKHVGKIDIQSIQHQIDALLKQQI